MGKSREAMRRRGCSLPSSSSSSSSDFEFTVSLSPSSSKRPSSRQCPADELFYKGQILPLHLSPRISMVRTLLLASSSASSSSTDTATTATSATASRDSNGSSSSSYSSFSAADLLLLLPDCDSSRPSSVTEEEEAWRAISSSSSAPKRGKYFSTLANRLSSVFLNRGGGSSKKDHASSPAAAAAAAMDLDAPPTGKRANATAKQVIKKYVGKVKPLYEKLKNQNPNPNPNPNQKKKFFSIRRESHITLSKCDLMEESMNKMDEEEEDHGGGGGSHSFSENLRYTRRKRCTGSCLSSMRSSPAHPGVPGRLPSLEDELQSAIQGAIAHCKSTMVQPDPKKKNISSEPQDLMMSCSLNVTSVH